MRVLLRFVFSLVALLSAAAVTAQVTSDPEVRFNMGLTHLREGRIDMALEDIQQAVRADGKNPYFQKGYGQALAAKGRFDDAIKAFRRALELNPFYVDVRNDLGVALLAAGKREDGRRELMTVFNDPTNPTPERTAYNIGWSLFEERRYDEALTWYQTSLARSRGEVGPYVAIADTLTALGRSTEAIAQLEQALKVEPESALVAVELGAACYRAGRFAEARKHLEEAARRDPAGPVGRRAAELLRKFSQ